MITFLRKHYNGPASYVTFDLFDSVYVPSGLQLITGAKTDCLPLFLISHPVPGTSGSAGLGDSLIEA